MNSHVLSSLHQLYIAIFVIILVPPSLYAVDDKYKTCSSVLFSCGNTITNVGYPFWGELRPPYCGISDLQLQCLSNELGDVPILKIGGNSEAPYRVLNKKTSDFNITLDLLGLENIPCSINMTALSNEFTFSPSVETATFLYNCLHTGFNPHDSILCYLDTTVKRVSYITVKRVSYLYNTSVVKDYASCSSIQVPVSRSQLERYNSGHGSLSDVLRQGFEVNYEYSSDCIECYKSGGTCGSSLGSDFVCHCKNGASDHVCQKSALAISIRPVVAIGSASLTLGIGMLIAIITCIRKRRTPPKFAAFWKSEAAKCPNVDAFLQIYGSFAITRYTRANIKKMTNDFKEKLGEGGYAIVYKGKLLSGRLVAVKLLKQSKGDGEDFLNEVASIGRTNHVNIVTLLGICFEGNKRALIYEFLPNGSLEKFTYLGAANQSLPWETVFNIAVGIARGLDYLHRGCKARILHFDIKPHNILLDEEFCPKISDFGLARLCPLQESTISMWEARGTIGYIAPEVFCRTFGGVSHKSDVYSFGMMVLDMVCGRKNLSDDMKRSSEQYFPQWIHDRLEAVEEEGVFHGVTNDDEKAVQRKMILVSLWCIQTYPSNRPSMSRVVEMLQGSLESIELPPKPNLSSPPRLALDNSATLPVITEISV